MKAFIRASIKGFQDMVKDPDMAVQMTVKYEPLLNADIERDRLKLAMECCIVTPNVRKDGIGDVDKARLTRAHRHPGEGFGLPSTPKDRRYFQCVVSAAAEGPNGQVTRPRLRLPVASR